MLFSNRKVTIPSLVRYSSLVWVSGIASIGKMGLSIKLNCNF